MKSIAEISALFGFPEFPHALFYKFDTSLRFELWDPVPRINGKDSVGFAQAFERASKIAAALYQPSSTVIAAISYYDQPEAETSLAALRSAGFDTSRLLAAGRIAQNDDHHIREFGDDLYRNWRITPEISNQEIDILLRCSVAKDLDVTPSARWLDIYLVDTARETILQAYDHRGMDIVAMNPAHLAPLYINFEHWLLDYDRQRMDAVFFQKRV